jgi:mono/diheme cytochrome c family protein
MNAEPTQAFSGNPDAAEPQAGRSAVPVWLFIMLFLLLYWGMVYFDQRSGWFNEEVYVPYHSYAEVELCQPPRGGVNLARGKAVFESICALCHNVNGTGNPGQAPSFVGSEWVLGTANRMIRIPQNGLAGPIPLKGETWNLQPAMPAMGNALSDEDLAAVLSYIRQSWGNHASVVTPEQVHAVRQQIGNRTQPWTAEQLTAIP